MKSSGSALFSYLKTTEKSKGKQGVQRICDIVHQIFVDHQRNDRITVPMFRFLEKLFDSGCIEVIISDDSSEFIKDTLKLIQMEINGCKDIYKLIDGITVLCQFIQVRFQVCVCGNTVLNCS